MQYFISIFVSAFLVFQIQPIISKVILPWFGGGASVWTTSMLFFQFFLLVGYLYAHILTKFLKVRYQLIFHFLCLILCLVLLPNSVEGIQKIGISSQPTWGVLKVLIMSLGFPYFILSANTPLLQNWFSSETNGENPYRLYAMSNIGSFLALVSYPILVEPFMPLDWQINLWASIYWLFVALVGWILFTVVKQNAKTKRKSTEQSTYHKVGLLKLLLWFTLSALGVILLVSTTSALTQNVPPVPFLWILPLALYLLTYVLAFSNLYLYRRGFWYSFYFLLSFVALLIYFIGGQFDIITQLLVYLLILLCGCMICHGELNSLKPKQGNATLFYLVMSAGGVFGSFLVSFVAMQFFDEYFEFPLVIFSILVVATASNYWKNQESIEKTTTNATRSRKPNLFTFGGSLVGIIWLLSFVALNSQYQQYDIAKSRNFYGILSVKDIVVGKINERRLIDGTTSHGSQSLPLSDSAVPLSYYRPGTGVELVIEELSIQQPLNVGIVGLGVGALAAYAEIGDHYTFYELNPSVADFANKYFGYIANSKATVEIRLGDARVTLQKEIDTGQTNEFNLLIIDAFSGDLIPIHLMTHEAFLLYQQHIKSQGVIALHISNRHLSLLPVVIKHSESFDLQVMLFETPGNGVEHDAQWVILTKNKQLIQAPKLAAKQTVLANEQYHKVFWTDDYSSLLPILKALN